MVQVSSLFVVYEQKTHTHVTTGALAILMYNVGCGNLFTVWQNMKVQIVRFQKRCHTLDQLQKSGSKISFSLVTVASLRTTKVVSEPITAV